MDTRPCSVGFQNSVGPLYKALYHCSLHATSGASGYCVVIYRVTVHYHSVLGIGCHDIASRVCEDFGWPSSLATTNEFDSNRPGSTNKVRIEWDTV